MRKPSRWMLLLALTTLTFLPETVSAAGWHTNLPKAQEEARRLNRPLLLHFYADWCAPCRVMEATVLHRPEMKKLLANQIVGVKVNIDLRPDLIQRYQIQKYPADVILSPEGDILLQSLGSKKLQPYLTMLSGSSQQFQAIARRKQQEEERRREAERQRLLAEQEAEGQKTPSADQGEKNQVLLGLRGFCPVSLSEERQWWKGDPKFQWEYQGVVFYLKGEKERQLFREQPHQYAPRLLGCDPVKLSQTDQAVVGDIRWGAFYDGNLYLFTTFESRKQFKTKPERYVQTRHVLRDDILNAHRIE